MIITYQNVYHFMTTTYQNIYYSRPTRTSTTS